MHEHDWTPRGRYGRGCACGVEEFEFSALEWAEATVKIERGRFLDRLDATAEAQTRRLHETLALPDSLIVRFDRTPIDGSDPLER